MGYLGRRIGKSQDQGDSNPAGANGAVGGGILDLFANGYFERQGGIYNAPNAAPSGHTATGGVISDYTDGAKVYRAHIFNSSGIFTVSSIGSYGATVDYLVVGGGGGSGSNGGGGGGAGGFRTNLSGHPLAGSSYTISNGAYTVTVGAGGAGAAGPGPGDGSNGGNSEFHPTPVSYPHPTFIRSNGGGGSGGFDRGGLAGGSGGGGGQENNPGNNTSGGAGNSPNPTSPSQGFAGGTGQRTNNNDYNAGGGGGATAVGVNATSSSAGAGGAGSPISITGSNITYAGGGGGARGATGSAGAGGAGGGGGGFPQGAGGAFNGTATGEIGATNATDRGGSGATGSGGGGGGGGHSPSVGGHGGSGVVVVRYQISTIQSPGTSPKGATGGAISIYNNKVIHTFTNSGTFTAPGTFNETVRYVAVGGGGGGGVQHGGGGGAGGYTTAEIPLNAGGSTLPIAIVIGAGGVGMAAKSSLAGTAGGPENNGNNTTVAFPSPVTAGYGGGGAQLGPPSGNPLGVGANAPLGSGGGGGMKQPGITADNKGTGGPQGNHGGSAITYSSGGVGGGGGGAGGPGGNPSSPNPEKGAGGIGVQVHPFFQNPDAAPTATTPTEPRFAGERGGGLGTPGPAGQFYLAGGGGGAAHANWPYSVDSKWGADGGFGGGGHGGNNTPGSETQYHQGTNAVVNTGGGGGATGPHDKPAGSGGSGIVLIAYPT